MARSSWAWANEHNQGPKKRMKKTHEHHNNGGNRRNTEHRERNYQKTEMGFSLSLP